MGRTIFFASWGLLGWGLGGGGGEDVVVAGCDTGGSGLWSSGRDEGEEGEKDILKGDSEGRLEERLVGVMIDQISGMLCRCRGFEAIWIFIFTLYVLVN